jgi:hypothetical protein
MNRKTKKTRKDLCTLELTLAREAARLGEHERAAELFARHGISYFYTITN